ncbi:MAG TPA: hypothetical protein VFO81_11880 [Gaiellaceae bacterium]|nr:hypothetical protein [Gaiellaceae bacterium]
MAAHPGSPLLDGEPLSPELVLVCPELAERARALLPDRPELWTRRHDPVMRISAAVESVDLPDLDLKRDDHDATQGRLEELTSLVDRIAGDWEKLDGRLAQLERAVARMEAALAVAATPPAPWLEVQPSSDEEAVPLPAAAAEQEPRARTGLIGTLVVVASVMAAMVAVELLPTFEDRPRLAVESEGAVPTALDSVEESSDFRPSPVPATTTSGGGASGPAVTRPRRSPPATPSGRTTAPGSTAESGRGTQTEPPAAPTTTSSPDQFTPARVFVWLARDGATVYHVTFLRNGNAFYSARVSRPRLTLPERIRFTPGSYRWIVRPGAPGEALGRPIVDSTFTIEPS